MSEEAPTNSGDTNQNRTFDEIKIGDRASLTKTITRDDVSLFSVLSGTAPFGLLGSPAADKRVPAIWGGAFASAVLNTKLPGPGTFYTGEALHFQRQIELGDSLTTTVIAREKRAATKAVIFDCECVDSDGMPVFSGTVETIAPTERLASPVWSVPEVRFRRHEKYDRLIARCRGLSPVVTAIAHPCDDFSLTGAVEAAKAGIITPILVGPGKKIRTVADEHGIDIRDYEIVDAPHSQAAAEKAVELIRLGKAELLMKGSLHTDEILGAVVKKDTGLRTQRRITHCFIMDVPSYPKPLAITDAAVNISPSLEDKVHIVQNAIDLVHAFGLERPRVAILAAVETINSKMPSTLDAAALCKMADRGQITGGLLDGPLAFDNAISQAAAKIKGIRSEVAGQADILIMPDLEAGNMIYKNLNFLADADAAGIVLGARVPIILTSRADSVRTRLASCAIASLFTHEQHSAAISVGR